MLFSEMSCKCNILLNTFSRLPSSVQRVPTDGYRVSLFLPCRFFGTKKSAKKSANSELNKTIDSIFAQNNFSSKFKSDFRKGFLEGYNSIPDPPRDSRAYTYTRSCLYLAAAGLTCYLVYSTLRDMDVHIEIGGKSANLLNPSELPKVRFSDVRGIDEVRIELEEYVSYLKNPSKISKVGGRMPKGLLMVGPPGVGKTLLAKAMAGEAGVPFFYANASEFDDMFIGSGAKRIRKLYDQARSNTPCVVFIDEIDSIGAMRLFNASSGSSYTSRDTIDQLLAALDGFKSNEGVLTIGATNFPDGLDKALTRPGRFDSKVALYHPGVRGRLAIAELYLGKVVCDKNIDRKLFARNLVGMTGADIANIVNQAAVKAAMLRKPAVTQKDLNWAMDKVRMGKERSDVKLSDFNLKIIAANQAGHAVVASKLNRDVHRCTLLPIGEHKGHTYLVPLERSVSIPQHRDFIVILMAGRAAEELKRTETSLSVYSAQALADASAQARTLILSFGYSEKVGVISNKNRVSDELHALIDEEAERIVTECYTEAMMILKENSTMLDVMYDALIDRETMNGNEIKDLFAAKPLSKKI